MARKYHQKEYLQQEYWQEKRSMPEIAREFGVNKETIRKWIHKHNIPVRDRGPQKGSKYGDVGKLKDEEWLRQEYIEKEKSVHQIANEQEVGDQSVVNWLNNHGIESRGKYDAEKSLTSSVDERLDDKEWLRDEYEGKTRTMSDIAKEVGATVPAVKYRLDKYGIERRESHWEGGGDTVFQRDPKWEERRQKRLEIDNQTCQDCGVHEGDYYRSLDVHHLRKREEFVREDGSVNWAAANAMDNMVSVCQSCHLKRHHS